MRTPKKGVPCGWIRPDPFDSSDEDEHAFDAVNEEDAQMEMQESEIPGQTETPNVQQSQQGG